MRKTTYNMTVEQLPEMSTIALEKEAMIAKAKEFDRMGYDIKVIEVISDGEDIIRSRVIYESGE